MACSLRPLPVVVRNISDDKQLITHDEVTNLILVSMEELLAHSQLSQVSDDKQFITRDEVKNMNLA